VDCQRLTDQRNRQTGGGSAFSELSATDLGAIELRDQTGNRILCHWIIFLLLCRAADPLPARKHGALS